MLLTDQNDIAILTGKFAVRGDHRVRQPNPLGCFPGIIVMQQRHAHQFGHHIEHADFDRLASAADAAFQQGFEHG